jgi:perosamine synthetase
MTSTISEAVVAALRGVLPGKAALHEPVFSGNESRYVQECIRSTFVSSVGPFVDRFEAMLAEFTGARRAVAVVNGTAALHACLHLAGVGREDEVIIPSLTFVATANAVAYCGAVPHFADSAEATLGMCPEKLAAHLAAVARVLPDGRAVNKATGRRIAACVPMHAFGHPADLDPLAEVCARYGIVLVEDAAESLGSYYRGRHTGRVGRMAALSFNGNKIVTTGGGGAILTDDAELGALAKHVTTTAKQPHAWAFVHDRVGFNYRMPNLNAALGCAQLESLPAFLERKRALAERYAKAFAGVPGVRFVAEPAHGRSNYWLCAILLDRDRAGELETVLRDANAAGFMARPVWTPMHRLPMFKDCPRMDLAVAEDIAARLVNIPSGPGL